MRETRFEFNAVELTQLKENTDPHEVMKALGYLATWNLTYPMCRIWVNHDQTELTATYHNDRDHQMYVIGAVWHEDHFGFHS